MITNSHPALTETRSSQPGAATVHSETDQVLASEAAMTGSTPSDPPRSLSRPAPWLGPRPGQVTWSHKFGNAWRGVKYGIRGHSSFFVHFFGSALVIAAAIVLRANVTQWCLLFFAMGLVLSAELMNSAIETLFHSLDPRTKDRGCRALDVAAGAVLLAALTAAVIGLLVFVPLLADLLGWP
ncbi:MAG TPA: diacylglycerol kinase [Gemmatales bacterium]|nr:diacylglycerol kinase [Gemmatales bacterium]